MRVAIVGGGISGLTAAYLLSRRHEVVLYEAAPKLGGHTYTVSVPEGERTLSVDMGFIVYNERAYPGFMRLLDELGVESQLSSMSFSVSCARTGLEYNGSSLNQLFAQRRNLLRLSFYRMLAGIVRFNRVAPQLLGGAGNPPIGEVLARHRFPKPFVDHYLVPMAAAIWSTEPDKVLDYPARTMASFLDNHGMLQIRDRPRWWTVRGGSYRYVEALLGRLRGTVRTGAPVARIRRRAGAVDIAAHGHGEESFDHVVIATQSDQALELLADPTPAEGEVLGGIPYQLNEVVLHTDESLLPRRRRAWASWNYHLGQDASRGAALTYYMNELQALETEKSYCVTLNRSEAIAPEKVLHKVNFAHPLFTERGIEAQGRWSEISRDRTYYCGAYWGYGFHEDGVRSGVRVARALGVKW